MSEIQGGGSDPQTCEQAAWAEQAPGAHFKLSTGRVISLTDEQARRILISEAAREAVPADDRLNLSFDHAPALDPKGIIAELVRLKDLKDREADLEWTMAEKNAAWDAARAYLAAVDAPQDPEPTEQEAMEAARKAAEAAEIARGDAEPGGYPEFREGWIAAREFFVTRFALSAARTKRNSE